MENTFLVRNHLKMAQELFLLTSSERTDERWSTKKCVILTAKELEETVLSTKDKKASGLDGNFSEFN